MEKGITDEEISSLKEIMREKARRWKTTEEILIICSILAIAIGKPKLPE